MNYTFLTDRLAVGDVASRTLPGFVAVVSLLATEPFDEVYGVPSLPGDKGVLVERRYNRDDGEFIWTQKYSKWAPIKADQVPVLHIDLGDGETEEQRGGGLAAFLDEATQFIADHIVKGAVLVHCGAGRSRSVAVVCAYLCRYVGMSWSEAINFVKQRRPEAAPASCFHDAVTTWLPLDEPAATGPRGGSATQQTA